jgi:hypothetical protein
MIAMMDAAKIRKCWILVGGLDQQEVFVTNRDTVPMERERRFKSIATKILSRWAG